MERFPIYAAGEFRMTAEEIPVVNPYTGEVFAKACKAGAADLNYCIEKALSVEKEMANLPVYQRSEALLMIADGLRKTHERFAALLSRESGKPIRYAASEVDRAIATFVIAAEESKRLPAEYLSIDWTAAGAGKEAWVKYFPIGLVAGISPFNFPLNLAVHKIAPAIAAGCPIILKPSSSTPLSMLELARVIDGTSLPAGAVSILPMDRMLGNSMASDDRFKLLSFTGSPAVGWKLKQESGRKHVVLELGGNAGAIVTETADLELAAKKCLVGAFSYSGQVCIHTQRIFVQQSVFKSFSDRFIALVNGLKFGDPLDINTDISSMIDEGNALRVEAWVDEAKQAGARVLSGGKRKESYYEPTVLTNTRPEMKVCAMEVFGPVVTLEPYDSFPAALEMINSSDFGLQAGVFTDKLSEMNLAFRELHVGGLVINDVPTFRVDHMPYGGVKNSGMGREGVKYAMKDMLEARLLIKNC